MPGGTAHLFAAAPLGLAVGVAATAQTGEPQPLAAIAALFGGIWPDWDHSYSTVANLPGRRYPALRLLTRLVARLVQTVFGHRGAFHSLLFAALWAAGAAAWLGPWAALAFFGGYLSHLLLDHAFTRSRVPWLWPLGRKRFPARRRTYKIDARSARARLEGRSAAPAQPPKARRTRN